MSQKVVVTHSLIVQHILDRETYYPEMDNEAIIETALENAEEDIVMSLQDDEPNLVTIVKFVGDE